MKIEDEFLELIEELKQNNTMIVVEGKKEGTPKSYRLHLGPSRELKEADVRGFDYTPNRTFIELSKKPLFAVVEQISDSCRECAILTDLDKKGKELYGKLSSDLQLRGVRINNKLRNFLFRKTKIRQIEGIQLEKFLVKLFLSKKNVDRKLFKQAKKGQYIKMR